MLIVLLLIAFLLSAWGNVIGAAFCPRYLAQNCFAQETQQARRVNRGSCHHEMSDMDMSDMETAGDSAAEPAVTSLSANPTMVVEAESTAAPTALDRPTGPCGRCWMHSQPSSGAGTLAAIDPWPGSVQALTLPDKFSKALRFPDPTAIELLEHSPPGSSFPRHIFISVFRI